MSVGAFSSETRNTFWAILRRSIQLNLTLLDCLALRNRNHLEWLEKVSEMLIDMMWMNAVVRRRFRDTIRLKILFV